MENNRRPYLYLPIAFSLVLVIGILTGYYLMRSSFIQDHMQMSGLQGKNTLGELIRFIDNNYVDSVDNKKLNEEAITGMLASLDPHSVYIPASEFADANDPLMGNFEGIGIQFRIERDTVMVINTIPGGPSEKVGLLAGDRIVKVDGKNIASIKIDNDKVMKLLKGPKDTKVTVTIFRRGLKKLNDFTITRGVIPTWSIDISYAVNTDVGYIKLSKFSATTEDELHEALSELKAKGVRKLILDLRGNSGGYLQEAIAVSDEFLPSGKLIVYTKGLHRPKQIATSTSGGTWEDLPLVVLIDEGSASASEIVAGAIQDNDRGTIIGRRSFGKGLVQEQVGLSDGSALRLTVARYYTPTGRSIQRSYSKGTEDYYMDYYHRMQDGELENSDSIKLNDSLKFKTPGGKTVYGGGGIMPDIFIPVERNAALKFYNESVNKGILYQFAFDYTDGNRAKFSSYKDAASFDKMFEVTGSMYNNYIAYAEKNGIKYPPAETASSQLRISELMKSYIARNLYDSKGFYPIYLRTDKAFQKAMESLGKK
ncbi:MAG: S41 family peptidase [Lentimicrobiaceae bacterium]|jgi:carboxyl-terminal processing protease